MIFLDSNIVIDLVEQTGAWSTWSIGVVASTETPLVGNAVVLAETARRFVSAAEQASYFGNIDLTILPIDAASAFQAGLAHQTYRRRGGERNAIIADFLICAHASALQATLITRDRRRFASYFPDLSLITPETHP